MPMQIKMEARYRQIKAKIQAAEAMHSCLYKILKVTPITIIQTS
jgi:hypothetical protein